MSEIESVYDVVFDAICFTTQIPGGQTKTKPILTFDMTVKENIVFYLEQRFLTVLKDSELYGSNVHRCTCTNGICNK